MKYRYPYPATLDGCLSFHLEEIFILQACWFNGIIHRSDSVPVFGYDTISVRLRVRFAGRPCFFIFLLLTDLLVVGGEGTCCVFNVFFVVLVSAVPL
jgi:hypothetical protein